MNIRYPIYEGVYRILTYDSSVLFSCKIKNRSIHEQGHGEAVITPGHEKTVFPHKNTSKKDMERTKRHATLHKIICVYIPERRFYGASSAASAGNLSEVLPRSDSQCNTSGESTRPN